MTYVLSGLEGLIYSWLGGRISGVSGSVSENEETVPEGALKENRADVETARLTP